MAARKGQGGAAGEYARAILDLASEGGEAESLWEELRGVKQVVEANPVFGAFLRDPTIGENERRRVLDKVFGGKVCKLLSHAMGVMNKKGRLGLLGAVADEYREMLDEQMGKVKVRVTVPREMDQAALAEVGRRISEALNKKAEVEQVVDESIIGGMVIRVNDRLIDASVRRQLEAMKERLTEAGRK